MAVRGEGVEMRALRGIEGEAVTVRPCMPLTRTPGLPSIGVCSRVS